MTTPPGRAEVLDTLGGQSGTRFPEPSGGDVGGDGELPPWKRWGFIGALVVLVIAGPVLALTGLRLVRSDELGNVIDAETDPTAPGFEALVDSTPTLLLQQLDANGALEGATLLSLRPGGAGGHVVFIPSGMLIEIPLTQIGRIPLAQARSDFGADAVEQRIENLLAAGIDLSIDVPPDQWTSVVEPAGTLSVDNPTAVAGADGTAVFPSGEIQLSPEQVALYLQGDPANETDIVRVGRPEAFWVAWLAAVSGSGGSAVPGEAEQGLGRFLRGLAAGEVDYRTLPVDTVGIPGIPATESDLYEPDREAIALQLPEFIPFPVGAGRLRTRVLNGSGEEGLSEEAARFLVTAGAEITIIGNAEDFDHDNTEFVYFRARHEEQVQRFQEALGVGEVGLSGATSDTVDVTVVLGHDYAESEPDVTPETTVPTTVPPAPFGVPPTTAPLFGATTVPFSGDESGIAPGPPGGEIPE